MAEDKAISLSDKLTYSIHKYSSYSSPYVPEKILEEKPEDQGSRWSSDTNNPPQFLVLKLDKTAVLHSITFGKYEKTHVCNMKKFRVFGGLTDENMVLLLESGLRNDTVPESFSLRHMVADHDFPVRYIKIMPLQSWGSTFNFSIWRVSLNGCENDDIVQECIEWYTMYREKKAIRLCLKHFRQHNYTDAFDVLLKCSKVLLEHPLLSELHYKLVKEGNFDQCEDLVQKAANDGLFQQYISQQDYKPLWTPLHYHTPYPLEDPTTSMTKGKPGRRGGHQMCIDTYTQTIYLFGGWDGNYDLSDLWSYHIPSKEWLCISANTAADGGPCARSCHKICLDPERRQIFTLGRYVDSTLRIAPNLKSDFYVYDIDSNKWTLITEDTSAMGGPKLLFDHQMVMDIDNRIIYVFGGRVLSLSRWEGCVGGLEMEGSSQRYTPNDMMFSGLYSYHVSTNTWKKLRDDCGNNATPKPSEIRSRTGHSMLFHSGTRQLYILAGQRNKEYLTDFFTYNIDSDTITIISDGIKKDVSSVPAPGFTHKATIDFESNEIHVLSGLSKDKDKRDNNVRNSFWVYDITRNKWSCVYYHEQVTDDYWNKINQKEPCPRFAHHLIFDDVRKVHYIFGGNPGRHSQPKMRLNDFWYLKLSRITTEQLLHKCRYMIRKHKFSELVHENSVVALEYLQNNLHNLIDHSQEDQVEEFQALAAALFRGPDQRQSFLPFYQKQETSPFSIPSSPDRSPNRENTETDNQIDMDSPHRNSPQPETSFMDQTTCLNTINDPDNSKLNQLRSKSYTETRSLSLNENRLQSNSVPRTHSQSETELYFKLKSQLSSVNNPNAGKNINQSNFISYPSTSQVKHEETYSYDPIKLDSWRNYKRSELFDSLSLFFPHDMTQPKDNLVDLIPI